VISPRKDQATQETKGGYRRRWKSTLKRNGEGNEAEGGAVPACWVFAGAKKTPGAAEEGGFAIYERRQSRWKKEFLQTGS